MRAVRLILTVCFSTLLLTACSEKEADLIADAQSCLDTATAATAASCVAKVDGIESKGAYLIRCVGKFVEEGFNDPQRIKSAMEQIDGGGEATESLAMMTVMAFKSSATKSVNETNATAAFNHCNRGASKGLILLSSLARTATTVASLAASVPNPQNMTPAELDAAMNEVKNNPAAQEAVGQAAVAVYNTSCVNNSGETTGNFCTQFQAAIDANGGSTNGIGQFIMNCYANPMTVGCDGF